MSNEPTPTGEQRLFAERIESQIGGIEHEEREQCLAWLALALAERDALLAARIRADAIAQFRAEVAGVVEPLREIEAKATPGPWRESMSGYSVKSHDPDCPIVAAVHGGAQATQKQLALFIDNAALIAELRNALPKLLALLAAQPSASGVVGVEKVRALVEKWRSEAGSGAPGEDGAEWVRICAHELESLLPAPGQTDEGR